MEILSTKDKNIVIEYDPVNKRATVIDKLELAKQAGEAAKRLKEIPASPDDKTLLTWAKENYPQMNFDTEKASLEAVISKYEEVK